ncbi:MAG TPA: hypothetical protein PKD55_17030 [Bellilinea sp.]|nr:hypothetical protein [Bellilinea sp.]
MQRLAVPFTLCAVWFMAAWAIERFWLGALCRACAGVFGFELSLNAQELLKLTTGRVSAVVLVGVPLAAYLLVLIPCRNLASGGHWADAVRLWSRPFFWLAMVFVFAWVGEIGVSALAGLLPDGFRAYADGYRAALSGTALGVREVAVSGRFGAFLGLLLGLYLFLSRGLARPA